MASPVNILVCSPYYPPHIGGLENHAEEFAIHALRRGHTVTMWTANIPNTGHSEEMKNGIQIFRFDAIEILGGFPIPVLWKKNFWKQYRKIRQQKYDIVISRTRFFLTSLMGLLYARSHKTFYMHIEHGSDFVQLNSFLYAASAKIYDYTIGTWILLAADIVIANSHASANFVKKLTRDAILPTIIYRGVEASYLEGTIVPANEVRPIILYVGRLIDGKGVQDLIYALGNIKKETWVAWIVGNGPSKNALTALVQRLGLQDKVIFWGEKSHKEAVAYIDASDIVINPSYTEGIPTTVIEAARAGKAIIATNVGGTSEVISDAETGILYPPRDRDALTHHLIQLVGSPSLRMKLGKQAKESMNGKFSWEDAMVQYEHVWNNR